MYAIDSLEVALTIRLCANSGTCTASVNYDRLSAYNTTARHS